jgi:limonene-1,2-epoxide hydrolase
MTEIETVERFLAALESFDMDRVLALVAPDVVYQNVPLAPARGVAAFAKQMRGFARLAEKFEVRMHHIAANGPMVLTERTDTLVIRGARAEFWVCGTFEVQGGKIVLWRDYFDWANVVGKLLMAAPRAVLGRLRGQAGQAG